MCTQLFEICVRELCIFEKIRCIWPFLIRLHTSSHTFVTFRVFIFLVSSLQRLTSFRRASRSCETSRTQENESKDHNKEITSKLKTSEINSGILFESKVRTGISFCVSFECCLAMGTDRVERTERVK